MESFFALYLIAALVTAYIMFDWADRKWGTTSISGWAMNMLATIIGGLIWPVLLAVFIDRVVQFLERQEDEEEDTESPDL